MIEFKNVYKSFKQGSNEIEVLKDLNFKLEVKGLIALVGKSGSGKSTLLSLLGGLDCATSGDVIIDGNNLSEMSEEDLTKFRAENIGIIFQQYNLIDNFTALENVLLPLEIKGMNNKLSMEEATNVLALVGLSDRLNHFPSQLSGGEKQRVAMARAYVMKPRIILADEPSGNLDPDTAKLVMDILFKTAKKLEQTIILVTHDFELASQCEDVYEIANHKITKK